jgi:hypothetical protein
MRITNIRGTLIGRYMTFSNVFDCITFRQVWQHLFTCHIFSSINKCHKFAGYLAAIGDWWGPMYGPQHHLQVWPGPMDGCSPAHLLLHSGVAPAYPCAMPVWQAADCCHAPRVDERLFAQVLHSWPMCSVFHCKLARLWPVVCFVCRINRRKVKGPVDWTSHHAAYIALWNARASSHQYYLHGAWHRKGESPFRSLINVGDWKQPK